MGKICYLWASRSSWTDTCKNCPICSNFWCGKSSSGWG